MKLIKQIMDRKQAHELLDWGFNQKRKMKIIFNFRGDDKVSFDIGKMNLEKGEKLFIVKK